MRSQDLGDAWEYADWPEYDEKFSGLAFRIDDYNKVVREGEDVYVDIKGLFRVGAALVPPNLGRLPAQKIVPKNWYDTIFYEGYRRGYSEGSDFERLSIIPQACEGAR